MSTYAMDPLRQLEEERLEQALAGATLHADAGERAARRSAETRAATGRLEDQNRDVLTQSSVIAAVVIAAVVVGLTGALTLDYGGLGAMADYLAGVAFPDWPLLHTSARVLLPLAYAGVEIFVGIMLDLARERARKEGVKGLARIFTAVAGSLLVPPVAFMIATHNADLAVALLDGGEAVPGVFQWKLIGSVALALVPHAALLCGGHWIRQAWERARLRRDLARHRSEAAHHVEVARSEELLAIQDYVRYVQIWRRLNADRSSVRTPFGPFDSILAGLVERRFGGPPTPDASAPQPPASGAPSA